MNRRLALVTLAAIILVAGCSRGRTEDVRVAPAAESSGGTVLWDEGYPYWWKLSEVVSFDKPIPCRGNVGMWQMPSALAAQVTAADSLGVGAKAIIVAHNHPSGDATPSVQDHELTVTLKHLGETLGVPVLDHLILGGESFTSI